MSIRKLCLLMFLLMPAVVLAATPAAFIQGSMKQIRQQYSGRPYILVLWSLDCVYCAGELRYLGKLIKQQPDLPLVLVSTDSMEQSSNILTRLEKFGLAAKPGYAFADDFVERLRWEIDPAWYGELPRNYLVDAGGRSKLVRGQLQPEQLQRWLVQHTGISSAIAE